MIKVMKASHISILLVALLIPYSVLSSPSVIYLTMKLAAAALTDTTNGTSVILGNKNNTSDNRLIPGSATASASDNDTKLCTDKGNGFAVRYPSSWMKIPPEQEKCIIFGPNLSQIFARNLQTFVRITVTNLTPPMPSITELSNDVVTFADRDFFKRIGVPRLLTSSAIQILYGWNGSAQVGLPYVNQSAAILSFTPTTTPFAMYSGTENLASSSSNTTEEQFAEMLSAIYAIRGNKIYVIEYSAPTKTFYDPDNMQAANKMITSFTFINNTKPA
jgi:hypothetical protein